MVTPCATVSSPSHFHDSTVARMAATLQEARNVEDLPGDEELKRLAKVSQVALLQNSGNAFPRERSISTTPSGEAIHTVSFPRDAFKKCPSHDPLQDQEMPDSPKTLPFPMDESNLSRRSPALSFERAPTPPPEQNTSSPELLRPSQDETTTKRTAVEASVAATILEFMRKKQG